MARRASKGNIKFPGFSSQATDSSTVMTRIFTTLAAFVIVGILATIATGLYCMSLEVSDLKNDIFLVHFNLGLITALAILLVHCIIFTYFLGTGRWVKEVGLAYELPDANLPRLTRELKRWTFPPALAAMLVAIATVAAGAGAQLQAWPWYVHASGALGTLMVSLLAQAEALVVVMHGYREDLLGPLLADHVLVELVLDGAGRGDVGDQALGHAAAALLLVNDGLA